jgi:hypothetical protein
MKSLSRLEVRNCCGIVRSPVKESLRQENFWLQVKPDTWHVRDLPMRHGAVLRCNAAIILR